MSVVTDLYQARVAAGELHDDPVQREVLKEFQRIADALAQPVKRSLFRKSAPDPVPGLYLWGGVGRGKSMLMDLFVEVVDVPKRRVHFHAYMQELHAAMHEARSEGVKDALQPFLNQTGSDIRLLAFDEMQISDITDAMIVGRLFEGLMARGVTIVTTSNRPPEDLYLNGLNRQLFLPFITMLREKLHVVSLDHDTDYRQNRLSGAQVFFTPSGPEARAAIDGIWADITGGQAEPLTLTVKGRKVVLEEHHNGSARATFFQLCGQALGPADYLAIAENLRLLVLEDIPRLGRSNFNEAKRFVTLIDALYEAKVRLIATAAAEPEMLYVEGTGAFEFERTASRLREMQDADWGL